VTETARHSVSVAAVVLDDRDRALLIRRCDNGHWEPPGGILELGEEIIDGLCREVAEETGLLVEPAALTGVYKNMIRGIVALVFGCRQIGGRLALGSEASDACWADRHQVAALADEAYAVRVLDALDFAARPAVRAHDGVKLI
jgi:8-oxo-dGTP diphosphatase